MLKKTRMLVVALFMVLVVVCFMNRIVTASSKGGTSSGSGWEGWNDDSNSGSNSHDDHSSGDSNSRDDKKSGKNKAKCVKLQKKTPGKPQKGNLNIKGTALVDRSMGIGVENPQGRLDAGNRVDPVSGLCPTGYIHVDYNDNGQIDDGECWRGIVVKDGDLGVGTITPTERLEVNGNIKANFFIGDGSLLTGVSSGTEVDPVFSASPSFAIIAPQIGNWDTAHGWGDHSTAGYLTSFTETDPNFSASPSFTITALQMGNWDTAYGWGNHSTAGYLTGFTELDPKVGTITTNYLSKWDGSSLVSGSIFDNGNIGIGTALPSTILDVNGTITLGDDETIENVNNQITFRSDVNSNRRFIIDLNEIWFPKLYGYGDDGTSRLFFGSSPILGNDIKLSTGGTSPGAIVWKTWQGADKHYLNFETEVNGSNNASGYFMFTEEDDTSIITQAVTNPTIRLASADPTKFIDFWHDQTNACIDWSAGGLILNGGNIGIGTTLPSTILDVNGTVTLGDDETIENVNNLITFRSDVNNNRRFVIDLNDIWFPKLYGYGDDGVSRLFFGSSPILGNDIKLSTGGTSPGAIVWKTWQGGGKHYLNFETELNGSNNASGYFMFTEEDDTSIITQAVTNPTIRLASADPTKFMDFWHDQTNAYIDWSAGGLILNGGNVGIGTANPVGKLDVNGAIYQRGSQLHADYVFESGYKLESIGEHANYMWKNKHLKSIPKAAVDSQGLEIVEVGAHRMGIVEELEKAHIYIERLDKENKAIKEHNKALEARLSKLEVLLKVGQ